MRKQKGISMVSLVITIVVLFILLGIGFSYSNNSIKQAGRGVFVRELSLVQQAANEKKLDNQIEGSSEEIKFKGFYKTKIKNPPVSFASFSEDEIYGYVIDLEYVHTEDADRGHDYKRFAKDIENNVVEFGKDDVYVCDKDGNVFYAKGYQTDEGTYYSKNEIEGLGPEFVSIDKIISSDAKSAIIRVVVKKSNSGDLSLKVDDEDATKIGTSDDGTMDTFEKEVFENKTYKLTAAEEKDGTIGKTTSSVEVTELDVITYVMKYDANGGTDAPASHLKTENIIARLSTQIPNRDGYTFLGWNENPSATIATYKPGGEYVFDRDITFFAVWKEGKVRTYNVTYNANGGTNGPLSQENLSGDYTISNITPTRDGYGFLGWNEDSRATTATYNPGDTITLTKNLALYAIWAKGTYTVTLSTNPEGAGTVTGSTAKVDGVETYISTIANPGYIFKNWTVKSGSINLKNSASTTTSFIMPKENVEIVANYEVGDLTVKYNANKGKGAPSEESAKYGDTIIISPKIPTRAGYDFVGWSLKQTATEGTYFAGQTYTVKENVTFYAIWKENIPTYTLTFNLNGGYGNKAGEIGKFASITKVKGGKITIPVGGADEPYRKDYVFKGWALNPDSKEVVLNPGDIYSKDADIEIYAVWKDETPPTLVLTPKQEEGSSEVKIIATAHDEGSLAGYAWTKTNVEPTIWETEEIKGTDLTVEKTIKEKGEHYFWVKDTAGNVVSESIKAYEIKYDANGGTNAPETQYQLENVDLRLSTQKPKLEQYTFLGWSTSAAPGNTESDVNFKSGAILNINSDITLKAVWGEAGFKLSTKNVTTQIDGPSVTVTVTKSSYTGNITVSSADTEKATATIKDNTITITPGTKIGDVEITVTEDAEGTTEKILVIVNRGIRKITLDKTETEFTYGDSSEKIGFTYNGKSTTLSTQTSNSEVATATATDKTLTIKPKNTGTATITLVLAQDDQYLEQTAKVEVTITKRKIIVTPDANQNKEYDGTALTPTITYTYTGNKGSETPKFTGELAREIGSEIGEYVITIGTLALADNGDFKASNYTLELSTTKIYFTITAKKIAVPSAITPQEYDGTTKYGVAEGEYYIRGGEYQKINAGKYTATVTLKDIKNYVWEDTNTTTAKNIKWEITRYNLSNADITVETIPNKEYTGTEITPIPVVKKGETTLENGNDYTLTYKNNVNVGTATITIEGKGNYEGTLTTTFEITSATMQVDASGYTGMYDNANHSIKVTPIWPTAGYTIYYSTIELTQANYKTDGTTTNPTYKDVGTTTVYYYIVASNFKDYTGNETIKITSKDISGNLTISGIVDKTYTGSQITQTITVKDNDQNRNLEEGKEYTVTYKDNIKVGTATITIEGKGNYAGTITKTFKILGDTITIAKDTEAVVEKLEITITRTLTPGKLQYKINNGEWKDYRGPFEITEDCTIYARSIDGENILGTNELQITNICEHEYTEVTCTEDSVCKYCGKLNKEKLGHDFTSKTPTVAYQCTATTCTEKATYYYKCTRCTEKGTETYEYGEALGHDFTSKTATATYLCTPATCTEKATYYYKCTRCAAKGTETYEYGEPDGHDFTSKTQTQEYWKSDATCTVATTYYYKCTKCEAKGTATYTVGSPLGHDFTEKIINDTYICTTATCTKPATYYYKCSRCNEKSTETYEYGEPLGHSYGEYVEKQAATCVTEGIEEATCIRCGTTTTRTTATNPENHEGTIQEIEITAATCTTTGRKKYVCSACNGIIRYETIAALGHDWDAEEPPRECRRCGLREEYVAQAIYCESDGSLTFIKSLTEYQAGDTYDGKIVTVVYKGFETEEYSSGTAVPWYENREKITSVRVTDSIEPISTAYWFKNFENCGSFDLGKLITDNVIDMKYMFSRAGYNAERVEIAGPRSWDTSKVTDMSFMFEYTACTSEIFTLDYLDNLDVSSVTNMQGMFNTTAISTTTWSIGNLSNWNVSNVIDMSSMFACAGYYSTVWSVGDLSDWNVSNVINMSGMFDCAGYNTKLFKIGDIGKWDVLNVTNMSNMFHCAGHNASELWSIGDLSNWDVSNVTNMKELFMAAGFLATNWDIGDLSNWDVSSVTNMDSMFTYIGGKSRDLDIGKLNNWNVSNVTNMHGMFCYAGSEKALTFDIGNLDAWNVSNVTDMSLMFAGAGNSAQKWNIGDLGAWNTSKVADMRQMFYVCRNLKELNLSGWDTSNVTTMEEMFYGCYKLEEISLGKNFKFVGTNGYLPAPSSTHITGANGLWYNKATGIGYAPEDIPNNTAATYTAFPPKTAQAIYCESDGSLTFIKDTPYTVGGTYNGKTITAVYTGFETEEYFTDTDIPWYENRNNITSVVFKDKITPLRTAYWFYKFENCANFDVTNLDTSNVSSMTYMFGLAGFESSSTTFKIIGMDSWNTSNVQSMYRMFRYAGTKAITFDIGDLSNWDTSLVHDMSGMFYSTADRATTFDIGDIGKWDVSNVWEMDSMFNNTAGECQTFNIGDLSNWNVSKVTTMSNMFSNIGGFYCTTFDIGDIGKWNVSSVTDMSYMFYSVICNKGTTFNIGDLSNWNVSNVTDMSYMFAVCANNKASKFNIGDLSNWDVSNVTNMAGMFSYLGASATTLSIGDLSNWKVSNVTNMHGMFESAGQNAATFNIGNIGKWDVSKVTDMYGMFDSTANSATTFNIGDLSNWNVSNVTDMGRMFTAVAENVTELNIGDLGSWNTSKVTNMSEMFRGCTKLKTLNLSGWDTSNVTKMSNMFYHCYNLQEVTLGKKFSFVGTDGYLPVPSGTYITDATGLWYNKATKVGYAPEDIPNKTAATYVAYPVKTAQAIYCSSDNSLTFVNSTTLYSVGGKYSNKTITAVYTGFEDEEYSWNNNVPWYNYRESIKSVTVKDTITPKSTAYWFEEFKNCSTFTVTNLDVSKVKNMTSMFSNAGLKSTSYKITGMNNWDVSNVTDMSYMFAYSQSWSADGGPQWTSFNIGDLSKWNTSKVTDMSNMFTAFGSKVKTLNLSTIKFNSWDVSNVTDMSSMFYSTGYNSTSFTLDISGWDTSNVTNMTMMFDETAYSATTINITGLNTLNTSKVTSMTAMFNKFGYKIKSLTIGDLSGWDVSNVTSMYNMFASAGYTATTFKIVGLDNWDVSKVETMAGMLQTAGYSATTWNIGNLSNWNVSKVTKFGDLLNDLVIDGDTITYTGTGMFAFAGYNATAWDVGDLSSWDVSNADDMAGMFCSAANKATTFNIGDIGGWNTAKVTDMRAMFATAGKNATTWNIGDLGAWKTSNVTNLSHMFWGCDKIKELNLSGWDTSRVTAMSNIFAGCYNLQEVSLGKNFKFVGTDGYLPVPSNTYITDANGLWYNKATGIGYAPSAIPNNTAATYTAVAPKVIRAIYCESDGSLTFINQSTLYSVGDTYDGKTITAIYTGFENVEYAWNKNPVWYANRENIKSVVVKDTITPISTAYWFYEFKNCSTFDVTNLDVSNTTTMSRMFWDAAVNCTSYTITGMNNWDVSNVTNMSHLFGYTPTYVDGGPQWTKFSFGSLSKWNTSKVTDMSNMFFTFGSKLTTFDLSSIGINSWDVSNVTDMSSMFYEAGYYSTTFKLDISNWKTSSVTDMSMMFFGAAYSATSMTLKGINTLDTSKVTSMSTMFADFGYSIKSWTIGNLSNWDVSNVTSMYRMFDNAGHTATTFKLEGLNNWNVSNVVTMYKMFYDTGLNATTWSIGDLTNWNVSNVTDMEDMFYLAGATAKTFNIGNLDNWNVSKVTNMSGMFHAAGTSATTWNIGDLSNWDVSKVTNFGKSWKSPVIDGNKITVYATGMFLNAGYKATTWNIGDLSNWDVSSAESMSSMFFGAGYSATTFNIGDIGGWNTSKVTDMSTMFAVAGENATTWNIGDLGAWRTSNVTNLSSMFWGCNEIKELNLSGWDTSSVTTMSNMFDGCVKLEEVSLGKNFKFVGTDGYLPEQSSTYITGANGFWYNKSTKVGYAPAYIPNNTAATYVAYPPKTAQAIYCASDGSLTFINQSTLYAAGSTYNGKTVTAVYTGFDTDIYWSYSQLPWYDYVEAIKSVVVSDEIKPISTARWFQGMENCKKFDLTKLNTSQVKYMHYMFKYAAYQPTSITLTGLDSWDTSNVTMMYSMFEYFGNKVKTLNLDLSNWDTSKITDMERMFDGTGASSTTLTITLSNWDTSNVKYMKEMFSCAGCNATTVKILGLTNWDVSNVEEMKWMFKQTGESATTFKIESLTNWKTSKVVDMENMLGDAGMSATTWSIGDLSNWDVSNVENMHWLFSFAGRSCTSWSIGDLSNWDVSNVTNMSRMFQYAGESAKSWSIGDLSDWDVSNVENMDGMFEYAGYSSTTFKLVGLDSWDVSNVTDMSSMFDSTGYKATTWSIGNLSNWDVSNVTDMSGMFSHAGYTTTNWSIGDLSNWNVSNVISFGYAWDEPEVSGSTISFYGVGMFLNAGAKGKTFNIGDLSGWNVSKAEEMAGMFFGAGSSATTFKIGNISSWNTSKVTDMRAMFACTGTKASYKLNLSGWNVSNVEYSTYFNWGSTSKVTSPF